MTPVLNYAKGKKSDTLRPQEVGLFGHAHRKTSRMLLKQPRNTSNHGIISTGLYNYSYSLSS